MDQRIPELGRENVDGNGKVLTGRLPVFDLLQNLLENDPNEIAYHLVLLGRFEKGTGPSIQGSRP